MKIKTRLTINAITSVSLAFAIGVVIMLAAYKVNQKVEHVKMTDELFRKINELKLLTDEYFLRSVERVQPQWESKFQSISQLLRSLESEGYVAKDVINEMQEDHKYIRKTFDKLVLAYERKEKSGQEFAALLLEYKERFAGQLLTSLNELVYDSLQLSQKLQADINITKIRTMWFIILFVIIMVSVTGILSFIVSRKISKPIIKLQEGAKIIGSGNLNARIDIDSKDEMRELAVSFNKMVEELRDSQKKLVITERLAVVGKLSGGIAHEIRNPLSVISASAYYLKEKLQDADEKIISHIERINNQVNISNDIIQNMQNLTEMKELKKTQIDIAVEIEHGINVSKVPQTVNIINEVPEEKFIVNIDVKQISIVFKNILTNAIQAMDNEGTIRITAHKSGDKWVEISFKDSGPGISQENLKKIFQPFFGTKTSGFGFGLALCKTIMEKHGGDITAQSEAGKETTFTVRFPC